MIFGMGIHENYDCLAKFRLSTYTKIMTSLLYHILATLRYNCSRSTIDQISNWSSSDVENVNQVVQLKWGNQSSRHHANLNRKITKESHLGGEPKMWETT